MSATSIEWTDHSWNPWQGCRKVSQGCKHCYMYREKERYGQDPAVVVRSKPATFDAPLSTRKVASGSRVFTCSWSDFFIEEADGWRADAWNIIRRRPDLTFQILTKRPERISAHLPPDWGTGWPHVWLGTSVEDQAAADERIPHLIRVPAAVRFLSCEPLLGAVEIDRWIWGNRCPDPQCGDSTWDHPCELGEQRLHWVIVGSESGRMRRVTDLAWARALRDQCSAARVSFFLKQLEIDMQLTHLPALDGRQWAQFPKVRS